MFVPEEFRSTDHEWMTAVVRDHPLALLTTNGPQVPFATHAPVIPESDVPTEIGATLLGHFNRANPHWEALTHGVGARLAFVGPSGYVTPTIYQTTLAAPTWNYVAVHLQGTLEPLEGLDQTLDVVRHTIAAFEPRFGDQWDPEPSLSYFRRIGGGVGAFRFTVTDVDAQFKLSQDKQPEVRDRVAGWFEAASSGNYRDLGALMRDFEAETP